MTILRNLFSKAAQLPTKAVIALITVYRRNISPFKPPCCRFVPTCSEYALEAFRRHGFIKGFFLAVRRVLRCNPFCRGGYDPVPEKRVSPLQAGFRFTRKK